MWEEITLGPVSSPFSHKVFKKLWEEKIKVVSVFSCFPVFKSLFASGLSTPDIVCVRVTLIVGLDNADLIVGLDKSDTASEGSRVNMLVGQICYASAKSINSCQPVQAMQTDLSETFCYLYNFCMLKDNCTSRFNQSLDGMDFMDP